MRLLVERLGARPAGIVMLAMAALALVGALVVGWNAVTRWRAGAALSAAGLERLGGDERAARREEREAAEHLPQLAATALPAVDLGDDAAASGLEALRSRVPRRERRDVEAVLAFHQALRGHAPDREVTGSDGLLLAAIQRSATAEAGRVALAYDADAPPHAAILRAALQRRFRAAWLGGDAAAIRSAAGPLLLLAPGGPDADRLRLLLTALGPHPDATDLRAAASAIASLDARLALIRALLRLAAAQARDALIALIPPDRQLPEEQEAALSSASVPLEERLRKVLAAPSPGAVRDLLERVQQAGRTDLAKQLIATLPAAERKPLLVRLAIADDDVAALTELAGDQPEYRLRTSPLVVAGGLASFHLATADGLAPRAGVQVRLDGQDLDAAHLQRFGSLVVVVCGHPPAAQTLEVRCGPQLVTSARVAP